VKYRREAKQKKERKKEFNKPNANDRKKKINKYEWGERQ
jgi:hypothetical protein